MVAPKTSGKAEKKPGRRKKNLCCEFKTLTHQNSPFQDYQKIFAMQREEESLINQL